MSVSLKCPSCGASVGEASRENNYDPIYYHKNNKGDVVCKNCGSGTFKESHIFLFILAIFLIPTILATLVSLVF